MPLWLSRVSSAVPFFFLLALLWLPVSVLAAPDYLVDAHWLADNIDDEDVRLYNGGWSHWGNSLTLPVVEGNEPLGGDFAL